jgi:hypothetical protein
MLRICYNTPISITPIFVIIANIARVTGGVISHLL